MSYFFSRIPPGGSSEFELFTTPYFIAIILSTLFLVLVYLYLPKLKNHPKEKYVRYVIIAYLIFSSLYKQSYNLNHGYPWYAYLPDATCGWAVVAGCYTLITKNRFTFLLTFFWGWGALSALYAPNMLEGPDRYYFYQFFLRHALMVVASLYMIRVFDYKIFKKDYWIYFSVTMSMALIGLLVSSIINDPEHSNLFYMLGPAVNNVFLNWFLEQSLALYVVVWLTIASLLGFIYGLPFYQKSSKHDSIASH